VAAQHALFPGSFDPPTLGHLDIVRRGAQLFDALTVAVAAHATKPGLFSVEERIALLEACVEGLEGVRVVAIDGLLVDACRDLGADVVLRGVRGARDFDYEVEMARTNRALRAELDTVLLATSPEVGHVSSTLVRQIASLGGAVEGLVPPAVARALRERFAGD
jgi:pantetheine-phosphate adenylyltransferase